MYYIYIHIYHHGGKKDGDDDYIDNSNKAVA